MGRLNVELAFTANTSQAKAQLDQLKSSLSQLSHLSNVNLGTQKMTQDLMQASTAAAQLKVQLDAATNVNTGKLSLAKFNNELRQSGMTLSQYKAQLDSLGPSGTQAFNQLAQSIATADAALTTGNKLLANFAQTLANVAKYQLSNAVYRGFIQAFSSAYSYAQDLNESLNKIRIVTGQSTSQMDKFAASANKAAKELSTTTTAYTDAALIFYQQGLNDKQVTERTNAVIKLANVMGKTASEVSDYMTAIWNNFDDGSESLEHYADVITALGAATAASSEEIATGLEKFAAIANTAGLSYEYATTALATVTAQTRQSAETVGTAFKTIFARIQDLEQEGVTEDGTSLGKYSQALLNIGVNIKDTSGQLKDMDTILNELGAKWDSLSESTKLATAQAVGGTRQYAQLIALMDNWDVFQENLTVANGSEGTLNKQADIYAESWEAARDRLKASMESIYSDLLDDDFFISITNGFAKIVDSIDKTIKGLGGLKGLLPIVTSLMLQFAGPQIVSGLTTVGTAMRSMMPVVSGFTGTMKNLWQGNTYGKQDVANTRQEAMRLMQEGYDTSTASGQAQSSSMQNYVSIQQELIAHAKNYSAEQQKIAQILLDRQKSLDEQVVKQAEVVDKAKEELATEEKLLNIEKELTAEKAKVNLESQQSTNQNMLNDLSAKGLSRMDIATAKSVAKNTLKTSANAFDANSGDDYMINKSIAMSESATNILNNGTFSPESTEQLKTYIEQFNNLSFEGAQGFQELVKEYQSFLQQLDDATLAEVEEMKAQASETIDENLVNKAASGNPINGQNLTGGFTAADFGDFENLDAAKQKFEELSQQVDVNAEELDKAERAYRAYLAAAGNSNKQIDAAITKTKELGKQQADLTKKTDASKKSLVNIKQTLTSFNKQSVSVLNNTMAMVKGLSSLGSVISMIKNIGSIWSDKDISAGEKLLQTLIMAGSIVPMVAMAVSSFGTVVNAMRISLTAYNAQQAISNTLGITGKAIDEAAILTKLEEAEATKLNTDASIAEVLQEKLGISTKLASAIATRVKTKAEEAGTAVTWKMVAAEIAATVAGGPLVWILTAIVALAAAVAITIAVLANSESASEKAAKQANAQYEAQSQVLQNLKDKYEELKQSIENYEESQRAIDEMIEGTTEWKDAISNANDEVMELLRTYKDLKDYVSSSNGRLTIDQEGLDLIEEQQKEAVAKAKIRLNTAGIYKNDTENKNNLNDFLLYHALFDEDTSYTANDGTTYTAPKNKTDAITAINALTELSSQELTDLLQDTDKLQQKLLENTNGNNYVAQVLIEDIDSTKTLVESMNTNNEQTKLLTQALIRNANENNAEYNSSEYKDFIDVFAAQAKDLNSEEYQTKYSAAEQEMKDLFKGNDEDAIKAYMETVLGDSNVVMGNNEVVGDNYRIAGLYGTNQTLYQKNSDGEWVQVGVESGLSNRQIIQEYATTKAAALNSNEISSYGSRGENIVQNLMAAGLDKDTAYKLGLQYANKNTMNLADIKRQDIENLKVDNINDPELKAALQNAINGSERAKFTKNQNLSADFGNEANKSEFFANQRSNVLNAAGFKKSDFEEYAKNFSSLGDVADDVAEANLRVRTAVVNVNKAYKENVANLAATKKGTIEYEQAVNNMLSTIQSSLGVEISKDQLTELANGDLSGFLTKIASGDIDAIKQVRNQAASNILSDMDLTNWQSSNIQQMINGNVPVDISSFNDLIQSGAVNTKQVQSLLQQMGYVFDEASVTQEGYIKTLTYADDYLDLNPEDFALYTKDDLNSLKDGKELYHDILSLINSLNKAYDRLDKAKQRAFGANQIKYIEQEIGVLNELIEAYSKDGGYIDQIEVELAGRKSQMEMYGAQFDAYGNLTNYEEIYSAQVQAWIDAGGSDEAQKAFDIFTKTLGAYKEAVSTLDDATDAVTDFNNQIQDANYEKLTTKLNNNLKLTANELKEVEYQLSLIEDDFYQSNEALAYFGGDGKGGIIAKDLQSYIDLYNELQNADISPESYVEGMQDVYDNILSNLSALQSLDKEMKEYYGNTLSKAKDELSKYTDQLDRNISKVNHYKDVMSLLGKDNDYSVQKSLLSAQAIATQASFLSNKATYDMLYQELLKADPTDTDKYKALSDAAAEAYDDMMDSAKEYGEVLKEQINTVIEEQFDLLEKMSTNGMGWDALTKSLSNLKSAADMVYTKTNQVYETNKMLRDISQQMEKTDNRAAKSKLAAFASEIEGLKNQNTLSKAQLSIAQAEYKVLQAKIALEEAQNAKSTVRLSRDSEGNYGYVYTADQTAVAKAEQAVDDAENALTNMRVKGAEDTANQILQIRQKEASELAEIEKRAQEDSVYRETQYEEDRMRITSEYNGLLEQLMKDHNEYLTTGSQDVVSSAIILENSYTDAYESIVTDTTNWKNNMTNCLNTIGNSTATLQTKLSSLSDTLGLGADGENLDSALNKVKGSSINLATAITEEGGIIDAIQAELKSVDEAKRAYDEWRKSIEAVIEKAQEAKNAAKTAIETESNGNPPTSDMNPPSDLGTPQEGGTVPETEEKGDPYDVVWMTYDKYKESWSPQWRRNMESHINDDIADGRDPNDIIDAILSYVTFDSSSTKQLERKRLHNMVALIDEATSVTRYQRFDTGGYTGEWGTSGKLAMLHEKELVLNKEDTSNILQAVDLIHAITKAIDLNSLAAAAGLSSLSSSGVVSSSSSLNQNVTITAEFPNAVNRDEISAAFDTLINRASQYANRNS